MMNNESLPGNPHYDDAAAGGRYYKARHLHNDADVIALAQVEATLALAYEQRTANLIAFYGDGGQDDAYRLLHDQIVARLGLDGEQA